MKNLETHPISLLSFFISFSLISLLGCGILAVPYSIRLMAIASLLNAIVFLASTLIFSNKKTLPDILFDGIEKLKIKFKFSNFFCLILLEEFFARWLFLGILSECLSNNSFVFCCLFLGGNILWCFIITHIVDDSWSTIISQFVCGIVYSIVFLNFGLLATIITHLISDSLVLLLHKVEDPMPNKDFINLIYLLACIAGSLSVIQFVSCKSIMGILLDNENLEIYDYIAFSIFVIFSIRVLGLIILCDQGKTQENGESIKIPKFYEVAIGVILIGILAMSGYLLLGIFGENMVYKSMILAMIVCWCCQPNSGSSQVCNFWTIFPLFYLFFWIFDTAGGITTLAVAGSYLLLLTPVMLVERINA